MNKINFLTAGESHGQGLLGIIDGIPAGLNIDSSYINFHLSRRQKGFGRGGRMKIENDQVDLISQSGNYQMRGMSADDFPALPLIESGTSFKVFAKSKKRSVSY